MVSPTTPMLQSVLLWQHNQTTTPNMPHTAGSGGAARQMAKPKDEKQDTVDNPPFDTGDEDDEEENEENEESDEVENG